MSKFHLKGLGTPTNSASYDNESAYKELLSKVNNNEQLVIRCFLDRDGYPSFGLETKRVSFKLRANQAIFSLVIKYLNNEKIDEQEVNATEIEPYEKGQDFNVDIFQLLIEAGFESKITPLFRTAYGYLYAVFNFPKGRIFLRLKRTDELMEYLEEKNLL